jgi:hypothetical protein
MRRGPALVFAAIAALGLAVPAVADESALPPSIPDTPANQFRYSMWFSATPSDWIPSGTIVVDSGFRPYPNGLPYAGFGDSLAANALFFDTPDEQLQEISSSTMRNLYGDGVCVSTKRLGPKGPCALTPAAIELGNYLVEKARAQNRSLGFTLASAGVFNGRIDPVRLGAASLGGQSTLTLDAQDVLLRQSAVHLTTLAPSQTPAQVVRTLIRTIRLGRIPAALLLGWEQGSRTFGLSLTPYAIYRKAPGVFDIAVYDSNYPTRERAVRVDIASNSWEYLAVSTFGQPAETIRGDAATLTMSLLPLIESLARQYCPVCINAPAEDLVVFDPIPADQAGRLSYEVWSLRGDPIDDSRMMPLPTLNAPLAQQVEIPAARIVPDQGYLIPIDATGLTQSIPVSLLIASGRDSGRVSWESMPVGAQVMVNVENQWGIISVKSDQRMQVALSKSFSYSRRSYEVTISGGTPTPADEARAIDLDRSTETVRIGHRYGKPGRLDVTATIHAASGSVEWIAPGTRWKANERIRLDYSEWRALGDKPRLLLLRGGEVVREIPMVLVTN